MSPTRVCYACLTPKDIEEFARDKSKKYGRSYLCSPCNREKLRAYKLARSVADPFFTLRKHFAKRGYAFDLETYLAAVAAQAGLCAICQNPPTAERLDADHDHTTGKFRGAICGHCNKAVAFLRDSPASALAAAEYLRRAA